MLLKTFYNKTFFRKELRVARTNQKIQSNGKFLDFPLEKSVEVVYGCTNKVSETDKKLPRGYPKEKLTVEQQVKCLIGTKKDL